MKKILAILLLIGCVLSLASCSIISKLPFFEQEKKQPEDIKVYIDALAAVPASAKVTTELDSTLAKLEGEYNATYADGVATVAYEYDYLNEIKDGVVPENVKGVKTGNAIVDASGTVTSGELDSRVAVLLARGLTLDAYKMDYTAGAGSLSATVKKDNTAAVLGFNAGADVTLSITLAAERVASIALSYTTAAGPIVMVCTFTYAK